MLLSMMVHASILTDEFARAAPQAVRPARQAASLGGWSSGRVRRRAGKYIEEWPNGQRFAGLAIR
jgi:hypothetical protein